MNNLIKKISDSELEVLKVLWQSNQEMTVTEIRKSLVSSTDWEASTIKTLIYRLCEKGIIKADKREVYYYTPIVTECDYNNFTTQTMIDKLFGGSAKNLVASIIDSNKLNDSDIKELRELFKVGE